MSTYINLLPDELHTEIYKKVFEKCLTEIIQIGPEIRRKQDFIYNGNIFLNEGCICSSGKWCEDCYGEYDLFD